MRILIEDTTVLTLNDTFDVQENCCVGIEDGYIRFTGKCPKEFAPQKVLDGRGHITMPGLMNMHCHSPMVMFRNFAGGLPLQQWMLENIRPLQAHVRQEDVEVCTQLAMLEMIRSGTTVVADMYAWSDTVSRVVAQSGLRAIIGGNHGRDQDLGFTTTKEELEEHARIMSDISNGRIQEWITLHSLYSLDENIIHSAAEIAKKLDMGIQIHVSETKLEQEQVLERYGCSSVAALERLGVLDVPVLASHCIYLTSNDMDILQEKRVDAVHCPESNLKLGSGIANVPEMLRRGINVCIGTDGAASNNNLNMFEEMHMAALIHNGVAMDAAAISPQAVLRMACQSGRRAMNLESKTGCIESGRYADLIMVSTKAPHMMPIISPAEALVYTAQASDVRTVIVQGKILMENGIVTCFDEEEVCTRAKEVSKRILAHGRK